MKTVSSAIVVTTVLVVTQFGGPSRADDALPLPGPNLGGESTVRATNQHAFGRSLANLPVDGLRAFAYGNRIFTTTGVTAPASTADFDGLGPLFNRASCTGCHVRDGRGRPPASPGDRLDSALVRISDANGHPHPMYGSQIQDKAILGEQPEAKVKVTYVPYVVTYTDGSKATLQKPQVRLLSLDGNLLDIPQSSFRVAQPVHGLGLLEAVSDADLLAWADPEDRNGDGISGRANRVLDHRIGRASIGRFGWKAGHPSLRQQAASAFAGDIGITSSLFPQDERTAVQRQDSKAVSGGTPELRERDLDRLEFYLRALAVPAQRDATHPVVRRGQTLFREIGCAQCHRETLVTRPDPQIPALANQTIHPYTDLLLHDMGPDLADGRAEDDATGREWRTPPLWGIGLTQVVNGHERFLHDGRARGLEEAVLWHGGEAKTSQKAFRSLPKSDRDALIRFLESL